MLLFLDTEYTDSPRRDLISIGIVSTDGQHTFYAERNDYRRDWSSDFVRTTVEPLLGRDAAAVCDLPALKRQVRDWFATLPRRVRIACDAKADQELLWELFEKDLPSNLDASREDIRAMVNSSVFFEAARKYHAHPERPWHHAFHDAYAHRMGWLAWIDKRRRERLNNPT